MCSPYWEHWLKLNPIIQSSKKYLNFKWEGHFLKSLKSPCKTDDIFCPFFNCDPNQKSKLPETMLSLWDGASDLTAALKRMHFLMYTGPLSTGVISSGKLRRTKPPCLAWVLLWALCLFYCLKQLNWGKNVIFIWYI